MPCPKPFNDVVNIVDGKRSDISGTRGMDKHRLAGSFDRHAREQEKAGATDAPAVTAANGRKSCGGKEGAAQMRKSALYYNAYQLPNGRVVFAANGCGSRLEASLRRVTKHPFVRAAYMIVVRWK